MFDKILIMSDNISVFKLKTEKIQFSVINSYESVCGSRPIQYLIDNKLAIYNFVNGIIEIWGMN